MNYFWGDNYEKSNEIHFVGDANTFAMILNAMLPWYQKVIIIPCATLCLYVMLSFLNELMLDKFGWNFHIHKNKKLKIKPMFDDVKIPSRGSKGAAGLDIYAYFNNPSHKFNGEVKGIESEEGPVKIPTGLQMEIPKGYVGLIFQRSSVGVNGIVAMANVIDCDYRGEVFVCYKNTGKSDWIVPNDKPIAQLLIIPYEQCPVHVVSELSKTERQGGFGSTDKKNN